MADALALRQAQPGAHESASPARPHAASPHPAPPPAQVRLGLAEAPGMDPEAELRRLAARFAAWKAEFKRRLATTQAVVKAAARGGDGGSSGRTPTLTARILARAHVRTPRS